MLAGAAGYWSMDRFRRVFFAEDAVRVIACETRSLYEENPLATPNDVEELILHLHHASVINLTVSPEGKPLDPFGTPFQVSKADADRGTRRLLISVRCAGPDRRFGTSDDILIDSDH
jgi:hypothetical protein